MADEVVGRRKALKFFGILAATATGREFLASWLPSAPAPLEPRGAERAGAMHHGSPRPSDTAEPYVPQFFKPEEFETVELLTEMIIPSDETPGAKEARVVDYIDFVVFSAAEFEPSLQMEWASGLAWIDQASNKKFGRAFRQISPADRIHLLTEMSLPERETNAHHPGFDFYRLLKEMTVEGFYTSRLGLIDVLQYQGLAFLDEFRGCTHPEHQS